MMLLWLDLETTGLDPKTDCILEVAVATAPLEDPFNLTHVFEGVLVYPHPKHRLIHAPDPVVLEMHTKNGLWDACDWGTWTPALVEQELLKFVPEIEDRSERCVLAGSSVHFDMAFLKEHMPTLAARFSHRLYDVSAIKLFARSLGMTKIPKAEAHRAKVDIIESAEHARLVANWFMSSELRPMGHDTEHW